MKIKITLLFIIYVSIFVNMALGNDQLTSFNLKTIDNKIIPVDAVIEEKPVLFIFWATWCKFCKIEIKNIQNNLPEDLRDKTTIAIINTDNTRSVMKVKSYLESHNISFPCFIDTEQKILRLFNQHTIPFTIFINENRELIFKQTGYVYGDENKIFEKINNYFDSINR